MDFSKALKHVKAGARIAREGWNGKGMYVEAQFPDEMSKMSRPYLFMFTVDGERVPWVASQSDLMCDDWVLAGGWHDTPVEECCGQAECSEPSFMVAEHARNVALSVQGKLLGETDLGRHVIAGIWERAEKGDTFFSCDLGSYAGNEVDQVVASLRAMDYAVDRESVSRRSLRVGWSQPSAV